MVMKAPLDVCVNKYQGGTNQGLNSEGRAAAKMRPEVYTRKPRLLLEAGRGEELNQESRLKLKLKLKLKL